MEIKGFSQIETLRTIQAFNQFLDNADGAIVQMQQQYETTKKQITQENARNAARFERDCETAVASVRAKGQSVIGDANRMRQEMQQMDRRLSAADKYYVKTKRKKMEELASIKTGRYDGNGDYFEAMNEIKRDYAAISKKYTEDLLPAILNGLNYLFSKKRKQDYEDLIILLNTLDSFVEEIGGMMPELISDTVRDMQQTHERQRTELEASQKEALENLEEQYNNALNQFADNLDRGLDQILTPERVATIEKLIDLYGSSRHTINSSPEVENGIFYLGFIGFPVGLYVHTQTLASFVSQKYKRITVGNAILFPLVCSVSTPLPLLIQKAQTDGDTSIRMMNGVLYSFLATAPVAKLRIHAIDIENHGNSVASFYDVKKKMPEIFRNRIITSTEDATERIAELNDSVENISQSLLGTQYATIYDYARANPDYDCTTELLAVYDFPKGMDDRSLSLLRNIILNGPKCGVYTFLTESAETNPDDVSRSGSETLKKLRSACTVLEQKGSKLYAFGLQYLFYEMPKKADFDQFFSNYMLINESIKNQGIVFPELLRSLIDSPSDEALQASIARVRALTDAYDASYAHCPDADRACPEQIVLGIAHYPADVFRDHGTGQIAKQFGLPNGRIALPLTMDLRQSANIMLTYSESKNGSAAPFAQHIAWCLLSSIPVNGLDVIVFDPDKKGGSIVPFLDFRKKCPETFDEVIYTTGDSIADRLAKLNRRIDELIQDKLGNAYGSVCDYNKHTPSRTEKLCLLMVCDFPEAFDSRSIDLLQNILKNGGKCGIYTVICRNRDVHGSSYENLDERIDGLKRFCSNIDINAGKYQLQPFDLTVVIKDPPRFTETETFVADYVKMSEKLKNKSLSFTDILDRELYTRDASELLSIPIGVGSGEKIVPLVFGRGSSHHALLAGATGSGKSTLLHTLIMSAMLHYSPDQLNLYLMDFKSGTEFKVYDTKRLPHIKLLALDAMQEFGESILADLVDEIARRSEAFKDVGASNLKEYVRQSGKPAPRILVIMDEFQILFNDATNRKVANRCAELTKRIVTEGRSYGIHLIMATQSTQIISDLTLDTGTIEQMRIRIGMKCGERDANYLFTERNDTRALEMMKGPIGTAVLNQEYTEEDNIGLRVAYCPDDLQERCLDMIAEQFKDAPYNLMTFEGSRTTQLLETAAGRREGSDEPVAEIEVGTPIKVAPPHSVRFDRRKKHNTLVCGSSERMNENITDLYLFQLVKYRRAAIYCFDGERLLGPSNADRIYAALAKMSDRFVIAESRGDIITSINAVYDQYSERKKRGGGDPIFLVIKNLQYLDIVKSMFKGDTVNESDYLDMPEQEVSDDPFDFGTDSAAPGVSEKLLKIIDDGTAYGIHLIVSCLEYQSVKESMYYGENILAKFPERYVFSLNENDSDSLIEGVSVTSLRDNTVYYSDSVKNTFQLKPYVFPKPDELEAYVRTFGGDTACQP